jgi:predicted RNase H-related nuclease YkuK (DUF458 family)
MVISDSRLQDSNSNNNNNSKSSKSSHACATQSWYRLNNEPVYDIEEVLLHDIEASQYDDMKFVVGGDSQMRCSGDEYAVKYCVVLVSTNGHGGRGYYKCIDIKGRVSRQQRLFKETYYAVKYALQFNPLLESVGYHIGEIHADLNPNPKYASSDMIASCIGYIRGMGFEGKCKPDSWASYGVADIKTK